MEETTEPPRMLSERVNASSNNRSIATRRIIVSRTGSQRVRLDMLNLLLKIMEFVVAPLINISNVEKILKKCQHFVKIPFYKL
jgi:hypothetical protein